MQNVWKIGNRVLTLHSKSIKEVYSDGLHYLASNLGEKVRQLLQKYAKLQAEKELLKGEIDQLQQQIRQIQLEKDTWKQKYDAIKIAETIGGENQDKTETKYKINTLIRQIDFCISELSKQHSK